MEISNTYHQAMASHQLEEVTLGGYPKSEEKRVRPQPEKALKCPRCESTNTKFCYYNNYSLSQPRYFCKGCRRYWTKGGSLRNVPVGGGCRKNKTRSSSSSSSKTRAQDHNHEHLINNTNSNNNPALLPCNLPYDNPNDLTLAFARLHKVAPNPSPNDHSTTFHLGSPYPYPNPSPNPNPTMGFLDFLRSGFLDTTNYLQQSGFHNPNNYYGLNGGNGSGEDQVEGHLLPFEGGGLSSTTGAATCTAAGSEEDGGLGKIGHGNGNLAVESARDYWNNNGSGSNYWNGLINSSLI